MDDLASEGQRVRLHPPRHHVGVVAESIAESKRLEVRDSQVAGNNSAVSLHVGRYRAIEGQRWSVQPAGDGFWKLVNLGTKTALGALEDGTLGLVDSSRGAAGQLWSLDQLTDGSYRISNRIAKTSLTRNQQGDPDLAPYADIDDQRWYITLP